MTRRCSHCSANGHNTRTCPSRGGGGGGGVRLFGVRLGDGVGAMKKSASMGCLSTAAASAAAAGTSPEVAAGGYASDDPMHASCSTNCRSERKKGIPWTEEEHRMFLLGLQKLGKGDWRGIARNYVVSRTPTQVASHAQKYFIRQSNSTRRKRRSSLFDMVPEMPSDESTAHEEQFLPSSPPGELEKTNQLPTLQLGLNQRLEPVEPSAPVVSMPYNGTPVAMVPTFYHAFIPVPMPLWAPSMPSIGKEDTARDEAMPDAYEVIRPTPVVPKESPVGMDEVTSMSKLTIDEEPFGGSSSRPSAFHIGSTSVTGLDLNQSSGSPIHAV